VPRINAWQDGATLALDREMRSITLTVVTRALLSGDVGTEVTGEMERLLHVLLAGLMPSGVIGPGPVPRADPEPLQPAVQPGRPQARRHLTARWLRWTA